MVMVSQGLPTGPLSDSNLERLKLVRYAVVGIWVCAITRIFFDNPFNGLATAFAAITGTYTFMNDRRFRNCYQFMSTNCLFCGTGGGQCMGPFMVISLINALFDMFRFVSLWRSGLLAFVPVMSVALFASIMFQSYAFYACLSVYKDLVQPMDSPLPRTDDSRRPFLQQRSYVSLFGEPTQQTMGAGFVPFGGEGRPLA